MYDTSGSHSVCYAAPHDYNIAGRLSWLKAEIARDEGRGSRFRPVVQEYALSTVNSLSTEEAYAWFGTFLGLFPPFAIFARALQAEHRPAEAFGWGVLFLVVNAVCCLVGRKFGARLGRRMGDPRAWSWPVYVFCSMLMATAWGIVTGGVGGAVGFIIGAIPGVICAVPVALAAFPLFAVLHRLLSRGGMIEERQLWPLVFGIPLVIAALILSPGIYSN
jgi:hypothetical protein